MKPLKFFNKNKKVFSYLMETPSESAGLGNAICGFGGVLINL